MRQLSLTCAGLLLGLLAVPTAGQAQSNAGSEIAVGYSFLRIIEGNGANLPTGWFVTPAAHHLNGWVSVAGDVAGHYETYSDGETLQIHTFQAGPRVSLRKNSRAVPYAEFLIGIAHRRAGVGERNVFSDIRLMLEPGGGADIAIAKRVSIRAAIGFPMHFIHERSINATVNWFRVRSGVVFELGPR